MKTDIKAAAIFLVAIAISCLCGAPAKATTLELKPGQYAMTVTYQVQGERQSQSRSGTRCITASDLDNPEMIFSDQIVAPKKEEAKCSVKELKDAGGKVSYDAKCSNRTVHVEGSLSETEFSVVRTVTPKASPNVLLKFVVAGKRSGECKTSAVARAEWEFSR